MFSLLTESHCTCAPVCHVTAGAWGHLTSCHEEQSTQFCGQSQPEPQVGSGRGSHANPEHLLSSLSSPRTDSACSCASLYQTAILPKNGWGPTASSSTCPPWGASELPNLHTGLTLHWQWGEPLPHTASHHRVNDLESALTLWTAPLFPTGSIPEDGSFYEAGRSRGTRTRAVLNKGSVHFPGSLGLQPSQGTMQGTEKKTGCKFTV